MDPRASLLAIRDLIETVEMTGSESFVLDRAREGYVALAGVHGFAGEAAFIQVGDHTPEPVR